MATVNDIDWGNLAIQMAQAVASVINGGWPTWIVTSVLVVVFTFLFWKLQQWVKDAMWKRTQENTEKKEKENKEEEQKVNDEHQKASDKVDEIVKDAPKPVEPKPRPKPPRNVGEDE